MQPTVNRHSILLLSALLTLALVPHLLSRFNTYLISLILVQGLLATSLNLVLGFGGMYQFHHAVFYGVGAYATALVMVRTGLPVWAAYLAAPLAGAAASLVIGWVCVRLSKLYFGMLQISLGSLVWTVVYRWYDFTGGDDGIHGLPVPDMVSSVKGSYYFTLGVTVISLWILHRIIRSPFGMTFQAVRDNPERCRAIGVDVRRHQLVGMTIAGCFAGTAGALFVTVEGSVFPELMFWTLSLEILIMCLLGGWFTFLGPMLGAAVIVSLQTVVGRYTEYWTLVLGVVLMVLILILPQGILGFVSERFLNSRGVAGGEHAAG